MKINLSKGQMYPFVYGTGNIIKGECPHKCEYCYMTRWGKQSPLHIDAKEMKKPIDVRDKTIFIGSSTDMFADAVPSEWITDALNYLNANRPNTYLLQTKNPARFFEFVNRIDVDDILACTIETNEAGHNYDAPIVMNRFYHFAQLKHPRKMISIEPVIDFDAGLINMIKIINPEFVSIGADSGNNNLPEPSAEKLIKFIEHISKYTKVIQKKNLGRLLKTKGG